MLGNFSVEVFDKLYTKACPQQFVPAIRRLIQFYYSDFRKFNKKGFLGANILQHPQYLVIMSYIFKAS
jgi:hypothetical protein